MLKDKAYWQVYNQKRKDYLTLKKRESRAKLKALSTTLLVQDLVSTTTPQKVVDLQTVVDQASKVVDNKPKLVVDYPLLTQLLQSWKARTNYSYPSTCAYSYCSNCWYFREDELIDYKEVACKPSP